MSHTEITIHADDKASGQRLDTFLSANLGSDHSRTQVQSWIETEHVVVNGKTILKSNHRLKGGETILVLIPEPLPEEVVAEALELSILYQDGDLAVINKPPGMSAHPAGPIRTGTLVNALLHHLDDLSGIGGVLRPGIVHRLDKPTSGILLVAKNDRAHHALAAQFAERSISKTYLAVVRGHPDPKEGIISQSIGRHPHDRKKFALDPKGKAAETHYEVQQFLEDHAFLLLKPRTGRTHQLRVHLASFGHPIVGDTLYGYRLKSGVLSNVQSALRKYQGILLHAESIEFVHPTTCEKMTFSATPPTGFIRIVELLRTAYLSDVKDQAT